MLRRPLFAAALLTAVAAVGLAPALAEPAAPAANSAEHPIDQHGKASMLPGMLPGQLVDGRIAFLKAELKITPAQEAQWEKVAAVMRENADALDRTITDARGHRGRMDAVARLEMREQFAKVSVDNATRLLTAFRPLYASLSPEQQRMADALSTMMHGWHRSWRHHS